MSKSNLPIPDSNLSQAVFYEKGLLEKSEVPVITVSASFRKELADKYNSSLFKSSDVVLSRAHYSMAEAIRQAAEELGKTSHLSDPTNFVTQKNWQSVEFVETSGQIVARNSLLKWIKDKIDTVVRGKLPISKAILDPLIYLAKDVKRPIISLHYEVGNILSKNEKSIIQVVTDPHVRPQYLDSLPYKDIKFCVFDEKTKKEFLSEAMRVGKNTEDNQVEVTGPPVDPRISKIGKQPKEMKTGESVNIAICTGGLGTNLDEIKTVLETLSPLIRPVEKIRLFLYAGTHKDFRNFFEDYAQKHNIRIGNLDDSTADLRILYDDSIIDANENLIKYMFPWAHCVITKPSGDMAYDAAAAGCFMLFLRPWGEWEENIQERFVEMGVGFDLDLRRDKNKLLSEWSENPEFVQALKNAHDLPKQFREGSLNIVKLQQEETG